MKWLFVRRTGLFLYRTQGKQLKSTDNKIISTLKEEKVYYLNFNISMILRKPVIAGKRRDYNNARTYFS